MQNPNFPAQPYNQFSQHVPVAAGQFIQASYPQPQQPVLVYPQQGNWKYNEMQHQNILVTDRVKPGKRKRELNPLRTERAKRLKESGCLFKCSTCEKMLILTCFGNRTQEKLLKGIREGLSCRECNTKRNLPNENSQKKHRIVNAHLRKPKALEVILIFQASHGNTMMTQRKKEVTTLSLRTGTKFRMKPYNEGAKERIGSVYGPPNRVVQTIQGLAKIKTEINGGKLHFLDFCIEQTNLGGIVGRGGSKINKIREESKAEVIIKGSPRLPGSSCVRMKICGTEQNFNKAVELVVERFTKNRAPIKQPYIPKDLKESSLSL